MSRKVAGPHEDLTYRIIGAAMAVHRRIGPGEREIIYQRALEIELTESRLNFEPQVVLPVMDGERLLGYYIPDFIIEEKVVVEIKAFAFVRQTYMGQIITYLNHTRLPVGLLINFGQRSLFWRRVFPSPQAIEYQERQKWLRPAEELEK